MANQYLEYGINSIPTTGRFLAHNQLSIVKRAFQAADLVSGKLQLINPTALQAAWLSRVNRTYVGWALKRIDERADIESGWLPLVPPPARSSKSLVPALNGNGNGNGHSNGHSNGNGYGAMPSFDDLVELAADVGVDRWLAIAEAAGI
jgi:hypothetical protein